MRIFTLLALALLSSSASASVITSASWYGSNNWADKDWCEDECLANLLNEFGTEDPDGTSSVYVDVSRFNGSQDQYCGSKDVMEVRFAGGAVDGRGFILCGNASSGFASFQPAQGEYGYMRRELSGNGWELMGYVYSVTQAVPEPGTLGLLSLAGLGLLLRRRRLDDNQGV